MRVEHVGWGTSVGSGGHDTLDIDRDSVFEQYLRMPEEKDALSWWIDQGSQFVGQVAGALTGASSDPFVGVGTSIVVTETLRKIGTEVRKWKLGPREEKRIGAIFLYTSRALEQRLASGESLRTDGFFDLDATGRSTADEIAEAIVLATEREHEERKIPNLGQLYAFIATRDSIEPITWFDWRNLSRSGNIAFLRCPPASSGES
jgi:hypothetical protein